MRQVSFEKTCTMTTPGDTWQVVVLSGPAGSGKSTIVRELLNEAPVPLEMSISATTRPIRPGEVDGVDYHFLSSEEFEKRRQEDAFIECAEVHRSGYWYGTLKSEIDRIRSLGKWVLLEIDVEGALNLMQLYPEALSIFLRTPSFEIYEQRLLSRQTETQEVIDRRLRTAREELKSADSYRHQVVNDDLTRAVNEIRDLISRREAEFHVG